MPGFFDVFFRPAEPVPEPPKPKKVKKAKKAKKPKDEGPTLIEKLEAEITELREMVTTPEPVVEAEEPEDDEPS